MDLQASVGSVIGCHNLDPDISNIAASFFEMHQIAKLFMPQFKNMIYPNATDSKDVSCSDMFFEFAENVLKGTEMIVEFLDNEITPDTLNQTLADKDVSASSMLMKNFVSGNSEYQCPIL